VTPPRSPQAVLLDRDGTINVKAPEGDYITAPDQVELLPGAAEAIGALNRADIPVVVVTNQRGIALGRMTESDLEAIHARLGAMLLRSGHAHVDRFFHCPHDEGVCACRKPGTALLQRARDFLELEDLQTSVMIGDSGSDVAAGRAAGAQTVLLSRDRARPPAGSGIAADLLAAVRQILSSSSEFRVPENRCA
jgi:D-glycero-D-manno-heptose 1,7-bisphosphate phosphatase